MPVYLSISLYYLFIYLCDNAASLTFKDHWVYWVGPILGAYFGGGLWFLIKDDKKGPSKEVLPMVHSTNGEPMGTTPLLSSE